MLGRISALALIVSLVFSGSLVYANPAGANVVHGNVTFNGLGTSNLTINSSSSQSIIDWQSFSIQNGETTTINQPDVNSMSLNRVVSGSLSEIYGTLSSNGGVLLINPNGIVAGATGVIDVGGMMALSTLDVSNQDFLDGGTMTFSGSSTAGVRNYGSIRSSHGDILFMGGFAHNSGSIEAQRGTAALAAGSEIVVDRLGDALVTVTGASAYNGIGVSNENGGQIVGAAAELKSHGNAMALGINNGGIIRATGGYRRNGRSVLKAMGSTSGVTNTGSIYARRAGGTGGDIEMIGRNVRNEGTLDAASTVGDGGSVIMSGDSVILSDSSYVNVGSDVAQGGTVVIDSTTKTSVGGIVDVSGGLRGGSGVFTSDEVEMNASVLAQGFTEGGQITLGGGFQGSDDSIRESSLTVVGADATLDASATMGDGGQIIVWSNGDTLFQGDAIANANGPLGNGGLIEISGLENLTFGGSVSATSVGGQSGLVLFDPGNLTIGSGLTGANQLDSSIINSTLQGGTSVLLATQGAGSNITFQDQGLGDDRNLAIQWTNSNASFGAFAGGNIIIGTHIRTSGAGSINLMAGWTGTEAQARALLTGDVYDPSSSTPTASSGPFTVQNIFNFYASSGSFGANGGSVVIGNQNMTRHVEVGSRYGDTNVAAANVAVLAADTNDESRYAQLGFRDSGSVFAPRRGTLALFNRVLEGDNDPFVGIAGENERADGRGVYAINSLGVLNSSAFGTTDLAANVNGITVQAATNGGTVNFNPTTDHAGFMIQNDNTLSTVAATAFGDLDGDGTPNIFDTSTVVGGVTYNGFGVDLDGDSLADVRTARVGDDRANFQFRKSGDLIGIRQFFYDPTTNYSNGSVIELVGVDDGTGATLQDSFIADNVMDEESFIPYADHYMNSRTGNWWWNRIERTEGSDPLGLGGNLPEHGAGSVVNGADINVLATGNVIVNGGGRSQSGATIGHGGDAAKWGDNRSLRAGGNQNGESTRYWSFNGASQDRVGHSIGRLAPVYGNINVLAGVDAGAGVTVDDLGNVTATITPGAGTVTVQGIQRAWGADDLSNPANGGLDGGTPSTIGHGGAGQFGEFYGDIKVHAGLDVNVRGGGQRSPGQIGHNVFLWHYWDPASNDKAQVRFFRNAQDFDDPLLRRGELFTGTTNIGQLAALDTYTGTVRESNTSRQLSNPSVGAVGVEALDGSVVTGFHGSVSVRAVSGDVNVKGFDTPTGLTNGAGDPVTPNRDWRYGKIGHGGAGLGVWQEHSGYKANSPNTNRNTELVQWRVFNDSSDIVNESGSISVVGEIGSGVNRALTFMTITGDIEVIAGQDVIVEAGNDSVDFAQIGHGGYELADYETSSFIAGNVDVTAGGELRVIGGGANPADHGAERYARSHAQVGHGGYRSGFMSYHGDIAVSTGGDILVRGGALGDSYAKIGHRGANDWGQIGGSFNRLEQFNFDGVDVGIESEVIGLIGRVTYTDNGGINRYDASGLLATPTAGLKYVNGGDALQGQSRTFSLTSSTANVTVNAGGEVRLDHLESQASHSVGNVARLDWRENSYSQIGHGGSGVNSNFHRHTSSNYYDIVGNVSVNTANDIILRGGDIQGTWSRIGHGQTGRNLRVLNGRNVMMGGVIDVSARDIRMEGDLRLNDSSFLSAGEFYQTADGIVEVLPGETVLRSGKTVVDSDGNVLSIFGYEFSAVGSEVARDNGLAIGHGVFSISRGGAVDVSVLDGGIVNGISTQSDISVVASRDINIVGGEGSGGQLYPGASGTHSQIGHGMSSFDGNAVSSFGFNGDIGVRAGRDMVVEGTNNGVIDIASTFFDNSSGGAAMVGHGGIHLDASASGDINVYVANDLQLGQDDPRRAESSVSTAIGSFFNFAKIGHTSSSISGGVGSVQVGTMDGDISLVVGNSMDMWGGRVTNHNGADPFSAPSSAFASTGAGANEGVAFAFSQVGHGGPAIIGNLSGDIDVLIGNDLTTHDGSVDARFDPFEPSGLPFDRRNPNNYVKIGHGDWMRDGVTSEVSTGLMQGDIVVAVGDSIDLEHTLIGHVDPAIGQALAGRGNTTIAVSRNFPFYGGGGVLTTTGITDQVDAVDQVIFQTNQLDSTVLTSGLSGTDQLRIFMPERNSNQISSSDTRLNQATLGLNNTTPFLNHGGGHPTGSGPFAGQSDEVFLAPDLWWMSTQDVINGTASNFPSLVAGYFPSAAGAGHGGVNTTVTDPGGLPNLSALANGALGTSVNGSLYRAGNGQNGGLYTFYYDVVEPVVDQFVWPFTEPVDPTTPTTPVVPVGPTEPFDFSPFVFPELFDTFERLEEGIDGKYGNQPDMQFTDELPYLNQFSDALGVPPWFVEEFLDNNLGPRQSGESPLYGGALQEAGTYNDGLTLGALQSDIAEEDQEEVERRLLREDRTNTKMGLPFYLYDPSTNRYSSLRIFGSSR